MKIRIICVGKNKEALWKQLEQTYVKRLGQFARVEVVEVADERTPDRPTAAERTAVLAREAERIRPLLKGYDTVYALAEEGQRYDSPSFSKLIGKSARVGVSTAFIIGGSLGIAEDIKRGAKGRISLSQMTFPHRMARIILLEQLFRAFKIINNQIYHK